MEIEKNRLIKDKERIRIAYNILEDIESIIFFRGPDNASPRITVLKLLKQMNDRIKLELERED